MISSYWFLIEAEGYVTRMGRGITPREGKVVQLGAQG